MQPDYALLVEFVSEEPLLEGLRKAREAGYTRLEAYSPYPVDGLDELLDNRQTTVSWSIFIAAVSGASFGFAFQAWAAVRDYPFDVAGTPHFSWPAFLPVTFELGVLCGAITGLLSVFFWSRLPRYNHPVFAVPAFRRASIDRFFLAVLASDPKYDGPSTRAFLSDLGGEIHEA